MRTLPNRSRQLPFLLPALLLLAPTGHAAASPVPGESAPPPSAAEVAADEGQAIQPVTLEQAVHVALAENLQLITEQYARLAAREAVAIAEAEFDPTLVAGARSSLNQQAAAASELEGAAQPRSESARANVGISKKVDTGATIAVNSNLARNRSNSRFSRNLYYDADIALRITQPLLQGGGLAANRARRQRARIGVERSDLTFRTEALDVVRDTEIHFYALAYALKNLEVQQRGLEAAIAFREENEARLQAGLATELDVMQARVAEANRQSRILTARQAVRDAADRLLMTLGRHDFTGLPEPVGLSFEPIEPPSLERAYATARENDPQILAAEALLRQLELDVTLAENQNRPRLDLSGVLGYSGRDTDDINTAVRGIGDGYNWQIDLTLSLPWGQREGRARVHQARLSLEQQRARLRQLEQDLLVRIRAAVRAVETDLKAIETNAIAAALSARETELERAKFDAGLSTSRLVVEAQQREDEARIRETQAHIDLLQDLARLRRIEGTSLAHFGVELPAPEVDS